MRTALFISIFVLFAWPAHAETPRHFAERFYHSYFRWQIRGVPTPQERKRISPFFSSEILRLYAVADRQRDEFARRFPLDPTNSKHALKGPWSKEGDPFSDTYEGITTFAIGRVTRIGSRVAVPAHLEYVEGGTSAWTDTLILDRTADGWVIADIRFAHGSLVRGMREGISEEEKESRETRR